jgi:sigma-B regulation protein RsbU (phosphoserine phosphatase)
MENTAVRPSFNPIRDAAIKNQLRARRERLDAALPRAQSRQVELLLQEVDAALERMEAGTYGICETCKDPIENDRLLLDPLCRNCIDHLSPSEKRTLELDLDLALQVQKGLLPPPALRIDGWNVAYFYQPAGPVSGDYCDLIRLDGGGGLFMVGDVSGKGVAASMLMAQLHAIIRSLVTVTRSVTDLVTKANRIFCQGNPTCHFATLICGSVDTQGNVEICNAGHCPVVRVSEGEVALLEATGVPVGVLCDGEYPSQRRKLAPGESLVLYTDGLSESFNSAGEQYGVARLQNLLKSRNSLAPKDLLRVMLEDLKGFRSEEVRVDDLTIMIVQRAG